MHKFRPYARRQSKSFTSDRFLVCALFGFFVFLLCLVLALFNRHQTKRHAAALQDRFILHPRHASFNYVLQPENFTTLALTGPTLYGTSVLRTIDRALARTFTELQTSSRSEGREPPVITVFFPVWRPGVERSGPRGRATYMEQSIGDAQALEALRNWFYQRNLRPEFGGRSVLHPRRWLEEIRRQPEVLDVEIIDGFVVPRISTHNPPTYTFQFLKSLADHAPLSYNGTWSRNAARACLVENRLCGRDSHALHSEFTWWSADHRLAARRLHQRLKEALTAFREIWGYEPSVFGSPYDEWTLGYINGVCAQRRTLASTQVPGFNVALGQASKLHALCQGRMPLQPHANGKHSRSRCWGYFDLYESNRIDVPDLDENLDPAFLEEYLLEQIASHLEHNAGRIYLTVSEYLQMRRQGVSREFWPPYGTMYRNYRHETVQIKFDYAPCLLRHWGRSRHPKYISLGPGQSYFHPCPSNSEHKQESQEAPLRDSRTLAFSSGGLLSETL